MFKGMRIRIRIITDFLPEMMPVERQEDNIFQVMLKEREKKSRYNFISKGIGGKNKGQIKTFSDENRVYGYMAKNIESGVLKRYLCIHVCGDIIDNSQKVKVSILGEMDKQNVVHPYNGI